MKTIKKILCPVDVYDLQPEAAEYALAVANAFESEIAFLYVAEPLPPRFSGYGYYLTLDEHERETKQRVEAKMAEVMATFCNACQGKSKVVLGQAADQIVRIADECSADMIIMASHGRSALGRAIHGSVTNKVLANTKIPVLVILPTKEE